MKFRNLDTFYWIASLGSFRAASEKLNLSQPAISARIRVLEQDLGVTIFEREARAAELTPEGRRLFAYAERLMVLEQDVFLAFSKTTKISQTIRLGSSETIVSTWLPDFLSHLNESQLGLSFDLTVDVTNNLRNALVNREIDLALLMGPVAEASVTNHEICTFEMIFAATKEIASQTDIWSVKHIASQPILSFASSTKPFKQISQLLQPHSAGPLNITTSSSLGVLVRLAQSGFGICAVPKAVINAELLSGDIVELKTDFRLPTTAFTASYVSASPIASLMAGICEDMNRFLQPRLIKNIYQYQQII